MTVLPAWVTRIRALLLAHDTRHQSGGLDMIDLTGLSGAPADTVNKVLFDANTILKADSDNTPVALAVAASRILGRKSSGGIAALTAAEVEVILDYATKAQALSFAIIAAN